MTRNSFRRRTFLTAAGATLLGPWLRARQAAAQGGSAKRFVLFYTTSGLIWESHGGSGDDRTLAFRPGSTFTSLEPLKAKLVATSGINVSSHALVNQGDAHDRAPQLLTGRPMLANLAGSDISIDQVIANHVGKATRFPSLQISVGKIETKFRNKLSYRGPGDALIQVDDPFALYMRVFGDFTAPGGATAGPEPAAVERALLERRSVLDYVLRDLSTLEGRVGQADRSRLQAHVQSLREIERRLVAPPAPAAGGACAKPPLSTRIDPYDHAAYPAIGKLTMDIVLAALACDLTRVVTLQWNGALSPQRFPFLPVSNQGHHALSHERARNFKDLATIDRFYGDQLGHFLGQFDAIPEGGKTMLDNSVVVFTNELSNGDEHSANNLPIILAGSGGGAFRTGRYLKYQNAHINDLWVSVGNSMGVPNLTRFGDPRVCNGPLLGLA